MGKTPSLLDEATIVLNEQRLKEITGDQTEIDRQLIENIRIRFKYYILKSPIALEVLAGWYKIDSRPSWLTVAENILNQCDSINFFTLDIGLICLDLIQKEVKSTKPVKLPPTEFYAWAIKFSGVYGLDLYFIPYTDPQKGFACTVVDPSSFGFQNLGTFSEDILREDAIKWIVKYKKSQGE